MMIIRTDPLITRLLRPLSIRFGCRKQSVIRQDRQRAARQGEQTKRSRQRARDPLRGEVQ